MRAFQDTSELREEITGDPRLSKSQVEAIAKLWSADRKAEVLGLDSKYRPVVRCKLHGRTTRYALMRSGDPGPVFGRLVETW